jgi:hypothetical protein
VDLKRGWEYVVSNDAPMSVHVAKRINSLVAANDALYPGQLRTGNVEIGGVEYIPPIPDENEFETIVEMFNVDKKLLTDQTLKGMYYMMRKQYFWDGNKRTSILMANYVLIRNGLGVLNIKDIQMEEFNNLLSNFYETNNNEDILKWTYDNCLFGLD